MWSSLTDDTASSDEDNTAVVPKMNADSLNVIRTHSFSEEEIQFLSHIQTRHLYDK
jgi:hypothetical protein